MTKIYFIRHAHSPYRHGQEKTRGLSKKGQADALRIAEGLKNVPFKAVVSSSYKRAVDTVVPLAKSKNIEIETYDELVERLIKSRDVEMPWNIVKEGIEQSFIDINFSLEGGESTSQAQERAIPIVKLLLKQYESHTIALGTHGNIMTIILNYFDSGIGYAFWEHASMPDVYEAIFEKEALLSLKRVPLT